MGKSLKSTFVGIVILVIGVIVGVILVGQTQIFKNQAKENLNNTYTICHKTGDLENQWVSLKVTGEDLPKYLNSGDVFGECQPNP